MKKYFYLVLGLSLLINCSDAGKSDDIGDVMEELQILGDISYEGDIKDIVKTNCIACHNNTPSNGASIRLTTYNELKGAVEIHGLIGKINSLTNPMPPDGRMPERSRRIFDAWVSQGLKEN